MRSTAPWRACAICGLQQAGLGLPGVIQHPAYHACDTAEVSRCYLFLATHSARRAMQILLLSMPDSFEHTPTIAIRMPNGALASLAGNIDPHHRGSIADLVLAPS